MALNRHSATAVEYPLFGGKADIGWRVLIYMIYHTLGLPRDLIECPHGKPARAYQRFCFMDRAHDPSAARLERRAGPDHVADLSPRDRRGDGRSGVEKITIQKSARIGFSTLLSSLIAYRFTEKPSPVLLVLPAEVDARNAVVALEEIFDCSPALRGPPAESVARAQRPQHHPVAQGARAARAALRRAHMRRAICGRSPRKSC